VRLICRQEDRLARFRWQRFTSNRNFRFAIQHLNQSVEWGLVLAQALAFVESE
jgi:hypothetical protein